MVGEGWWLGYNTKAGGKELEVRLRGLCGKRGGGDGGATPGGEVGW
jgi:hypothetical protein